MNCLDVGCGPGEVMRLMGETVGQAGQVTGIDVDARLGREVIELLRATRISQFDFIEADLESVDDVAGKPFDLVFARLVLIHLRDPKALLRRMYEWTRPGGYVVVQDYDLRTVDVYPRLVNWSLFEKVFWGVFTAAGRDMNLGIKLPGYFVDAGIGPPDGTDTYCRAWPLTEAAGMIQGVYQSLLPQAIESGITTEAESRAFLEELRMATTSEQYYCNLSPLLVGVWKRKPA